LNEFLDGAAAPASALVIEGEAGIGKTTLWRAGVELAAFVPLALLERRPFRRNASSPTSASAIFSTAHSTTCCRYSPHRGGGRSRSPSSASRPVTPHRT
jgi:hypothetical protein